MRIKLLQSAESISACLTEITVKLKPVFLSGLLLVLLALAFSSCADQEGTEGSGLDGPPDSAPSRSSLGPGGSSINRSW